MSPGQATENEWTTSTGCSRNQRRARTPKRRKPKPVWRRMPRESVKVEAAGEGVWREGVEFGGAGVAAAGAFGIEAGAEGGGTVAADADGHVVTDDVDFAAPADKFVGEPNGELFSKSAGGVEVLDNEADVHGITVEQPRGGGQWRGGRIYS